MRKDDDKSQGDPKPDGDAKQKRADYEIGYARPPKDTQFRPGQSGNPSGKRKSKAPFEPFTIALRQKTSVVRGSIKRLLPIHAVIAEQIVMAAARGNLPSAKYAFAQARAESLNDPYDYDLLTLEELQELERMMIKSLKR